MRGFFFFLTHSVIGSGDTSAWFILSVAQVHDRELVLHLRDWGLGGSVGSALLCAAYVRWCFNTISR